MFVSSPRTVCRPANKLAFHLRSIIFPMTWGALALALALVIPGTQSVRAEASGDVRARYADALAFCSGTVTRPLALRDDNRILCLDGLLFHEVEASPAMNLEPGGYVVVRGLGGDVAGVLKLAEFIEARRATVVVRDYCLGACANYLFIAGVEVIVPKDALVAWTNLKSRPGDCYRFLETTDRNAPRFVSGDCTSSLHPPFGDPLFARKRSFYGRRLLSGPVPEPPESVAVRRILKRRYDETGRYPAELFWTWNPRYYAKTLKSRIHYEAYPRSQDEVDALVERLKLQYRVVYDP